MEPVRCFTCNAVLRFQQYEALTTSLGAAAAFGEMGVRRFCCRRMYLSHPVELEEHLRSFPLRNSECKEYAVRFECETECVVSTD